MSLSSSYELNEGVITLDAKPSSAFWRKTWGVLLGMWIAGCVFGGFEKGIIYLMRDKYSYDASPWGDHYLLRIIVDAISGGTGAALAGFVGRRLGGVLGFLVNVPYLLLCGGVVLFGVGSVMDQPIFGKWHPPLSGWAAVTFLAIAAAGVLGGFLGEKSYPDLAHLDEGRGRKTLLGIWWGHWLWLWLPFQFFTTELVLPLYLMWLEFALGWHFAVHPSLWFRPSWWLYLTFGAGIAWIPVALVIWGYAKAYEVVAFGRDQHGFRWWQSVWRFLAWWAGAPLVARLVSMGLVWWLSHLPVKIAKSHMPWWIIFK